MSWLAGGNNYAPPKIVFIVRADEIISVTPWLCSMTGNHVILAHHLFPSFCHVQCQRCLKRFFPPAVPPPHPCSPVVPTLTVRVLVIFFPSCFLSFSLSVPSHPANPPAPTPAENDSQSIFTFWFSPLSVPSTHSLLFPTTPTLLVSILLCPSEHLF